VLSEFVAPAPDLADVVERIWSWRGEAAELPTLLPGTGAELVFQHGAPLKAGVDLPTAALLCLRRSRWSLSAAGEVHFTAVRFRAGALRYFTTVPVSEMVDAATPVGELFPVRCGDGSLGRRAAALQAQLRRLRRPADPVVQAAVRRVYRDPARARLSLLTSQLGVSGRHLRRGFLAAVGVAPKEFQELARFQRVVRTVLLEAPVSYLPVALAAGYYDQSHFIKEFRRFAGGRPTRLLTPTMSHFYYPSIG
jgi:AraC-like DNA-binding protein